MALSTHSPQSYNLTPATSPQRNLFSSKKATKKGGTFTDLYPPEGLAAAAAAGPSGSAIQTGPSTSANSTGEGISSGVLPFSPDFMQVFFTLADTLIEVYSKMALLMGKDPQQTHRQPPSAAKKWPQQQQYTQPQQQQLHNQHASVSSIQPGSFSTDKGSSPPSINLPSFGGITEETPDLSGSYASSSASLNAPASMLIPPSSIDNVAKVDAKIKVSRTNNRLTCLAIQLTSSLAFTENHRPNLKRARHRQSAHHQRRARSFRVRSQPAPRQFSRYGRQLIPRCPRIHAINRHTDTVRRPDECRQPLDWSTSTSNEHW